MIFHNTVNLSQQRRSRELTVDLDHTQVDVSPQRLPQLVEVVRGKPPERGSTHPVHRALVDVDELVERLV